MFNNGFTVPMIEPLRSVGICRRYELVFNFETEPRTVYNRTGSGQELCRVQQAAARLSETALCCDNDLLSPVACPPLAADDPTTTVCLCRLVQDSSSATRENETAALHNPLSIRDRWWSSAG